MRFKDKVHILCELISGQTVYQGQVWNTVHIMEIYEYLAVSDEMYNMQRNVEVHNNTSYYFCTPSEGVECSAL